MTERLEGSFDGKNWTVIMERKNGELILYFSLKNGLFKYIRIITF